MGCPVVGALGLPVFDHIGPGGQVRLASLDAPVVADAIAEVVDPPRNAELRAAARDLELPTWRSYAAEVAGWTATVTGS